MASSISEVEPALWREDAPRHFDLRIPAWVKIGIVALAAVLAIYFLDAPVAAWTLRTHPIPDLNNPAARHGDIAHELMWMEQWGQGICSVVVILAVALLDPKGRRRALAIALGCIATVVLTLLLKDLCGRNRPFVDLNAELHLNVPAGSWIWGGPAMGFTHGSSWNSFPSAHTSAAFALSAGLSWFYPRARALFMTLALITAAQRILHSAHFVSDTVAGLGIGVLMSRATLKANLSGRLIHAAPPPLRRWWLQL